ncbi:hypothetical protein M434DRAFT_41665, partial [Hypoxylon sp. CO27-5]
TALHLSVISRSPDILKILLEVGCEPNVTGRDGIMPVHLCYNDEDQDMLRVLIEHGASTVAQDEDMETIWHICAKWDSAEVLRALIEVDQDRDIALRLESSEYGSLFHLAACWGSTRALDSILTIGADIEQEFGEHGTALMVSATNGQLDAVKYLVRKGA